jgi:acyl-CoA thioester hydrolase
MTSPNPSTAEASAQPETDLLPSVMIQRQVEWIDTDASGHHHHSVVQRWVEAAESVLLEQLGVGHLFGRIPRVHYEVDYRSRLWHGQQVQIELAIVRVGEKSMRYDFVVRSEDRVAATGNLVIAMAAPDSPHAVPWPDDVRRALTSGGPQQGTPQAELAPE